MDSPLQDPTSKVFLEFKQKVNLEVFKVQCTTFIFLDSVHCNFIT